MSHEVAGQDSVPLPSRVAAARVGRHSRLQLGRALWVQVHLYLGLSAGALLVLFGLTGSLLVFWQEIDEWLNPALLTVPVPPETGGNYRSWGEILAAAERAALPESAITQVYAPAGSQGVAAVYLQHPSKAWQRVYVDPYRAVVTGIRTYGAGELVPMYLMDVVFQLHYALFLGERGMTAAAIGALLLILSLVTGLIVWWPRGGQWRQAFVIRRPSRPFRLLFDLHKTSSLYTCLVLGAVLLSGVYMNMADPFIRVTQLFSPATRGTVTAPEPGADSGAPSISAERAEAIAASRYPEGSLAWITMPDGPRGVYQIVRQNVPRLSPFWSERIVSIDPSSGEILDVRAPDTRRSAGETFIDWQWPLHSGKAFGWGGRLVVFVAGLSCPVIYVTGLLMWWRKRRRREQGVSASGLTPTRKEAAR